MSKAWLMLLVVAGCDTGGGTGTVDPKPDAPVIPVETLDECPAFVAGMVEDSPTMFIPKETTITVGQVVKFLITSEHFVLPNTLTTTDPALNVGRGETKCFRFNVPGTYGFLCGVHSFTGTIVVQ